MKEGARFAPGRSMEEPHLTAVCRVCGQQEFKYVGLQWLPISMIIKMGGTPRSVDPEKPDRAAVKLFICQRCGNSYIEV